MALAPPHTLTKIGRIRRVDTLQLRSGSARHSGHSVTSFLQSNSPMRTALVFALVLTLAACESSVTQPTWTMRPCDAARVDLVLQRGQPDSVHRDNPDIRYQTKETDFYTTVNDVLNTETTGAYSFEWNTPAAKSAPDACLRDTTVTTVPIE